jgi:dTDP-4-dehydrorhamnose reductase
MHSKKILVLGQGLLGTEITKQTNWNYLSRKDHKFDICNFENFKKTMLNYDTIVNCIANTNTYSESKEEHWNVNYKAVYDLCLFCKDNNIKLVHISSDFVYANNSIVEPSELQPPIPSENWYSVTKLLADCVIELVCDNYLILRCTHKNFPFP